MPKLPDTDDPVAWELRELSERVGRLREQLTVFLQRAKLHEPLDAERTTGRPRGPADR